MRRIVLQCPNAGALARHAGFDSASILAGDFFSIAASIASNDDQQAPR
jgi:hypothetical protein